jgi:hypothetical protein
VPGAAMTAAAAANAKVLIMSWFLCQRFVL